MPDPRAILIAAGVGLGVAGYTVLWWHWPVPFGAGAGLLLAGLALTSFAGGGTDESEADAAWRAAAPDLAEEPAGPPPDDDPAGGVRVSAAGAEPGRSRDIPSGD
ncbi:MAG: hypothetical protein EPO36_03160 [Chloroflexota bacterium]|nr:MAG: hypothetical protein EPO36_03160 [Chloroflexota bacterium]